MRKRTLKELNLLDNYLFGTMVTYPEIGERFSRHLLETILQRKLPNIRVAGQKVIYGKDTEFHGIRLELLCYLEDTDSENAVNGVLREIEDMVEIVREDAEVTTGDMVWMESKEKLIEEGIQIGEILVMLAIENKIIMMYTTINIKWTGCKLWMNWRKYHGQ